MSFFSLQYILRHPRRVYTTLVNAADVVNNDDYEAKMIYGIN